MNDMNDKKIIVGGYKHNIINIEYDNNTDISKDIEIEVFDNKNEKYINYNNYINNYMNSKNHKNFKNNNNSCYFNSIM